MKILSPMKGTHVPLEQVSDPVFAQKMLGEGTAILPTDNTIVAPISGTLASVFPTGHAIGIKGANGEEVLIHIGIDTVKLDGKHFEVKVSQNAIVTAGTPLIIADFNEIKHAGYDITTMIIITNTTDYEAVHDIATSNIEALDPILEVVEVKKKKRFWSR